MARCVLLGLFLTVSAAAQDAPFRFLTFEAVVQAPGNDELRWPVAVAAASTVEIAVADVFGSRLVIFRLAGGEFRHERSVSLPAPPRAVAHDGSRYAVALRGGRLVEVAGPGFRPRSIRLPAAAVAGTVAAAAGGGFWVHDPEGAQALRLGTDGNVRAAVAVEGRPSVLAASPEGGFYAAFVEGAEVRRYARDGRLLGSWSLAGEPPRPAWPSGLVVTESGELVVADRQAARIVAFDAAGQRVGVGARRGWTPGRLNAPAGIARLGDGRLVVADQGNGRVQIFRRVERATP